MTRNYDSQKVENTLEQYSPNMKRGAYQEMGLQGEGGEVVIEIILEKTQDTDHLL
jgi:hypothetical protein